MSSIWQDTMKTVVAQPLMGLVYIGAGATALVGVLFVAPYLVWIWHSIWGARATDDVVEVEEVAPRPRPRGNAAR